MSLPDAARADVLTCGRREVRASFRCTRPYPDRLAVATIDHVSTSAQAACEILIREATALDAQALATVHVTSWRAAYRGVIEDAYLDSLSVDRRREASLAWFRNPTPSTFVRVAVDANAKVVGYAMGGPARTGAPTTLGEVYVLYLLPDVQRRGIGTQLMRSMARGLDLRGMEALEIWALEANAARAFYTRLGGRLADARDTRVGSRQLREVAYRWDGLSALFQAPAPAD